MLQKIQIVACALLLSACGSESEQNKGIDINFDALKGSSANPTITPTTAADGDSINLNTRVTGTITEGGIVGFTFSAPASQYVFVSLTSSAEDLDLSVYGGLVDEYSAGMDSNEIVVFPTQQDQSYTVDVESWVGAGDFEVTLAEATRATLGLSYDEYLYRLTYNETGSCDNGSDYSDVYDVSVIVNFVDGYFEFLDSPIRFPFTAVSGNSFTLSGNGEDREDGYVYKYAYKTQLSVNPEDATLSGSETYSNEETGGGMTTACNYASVLAGELLL